MRRVQRSQKKGVAKTTAPWSIAVAIKGLHRHGEQGHFQQVAFEERGEGFQRSALKQNVVAGLNDDSFGQIRAGPVWVDLHRQGGRD